MRGAQCLKCTYVDWCAIWFFLGLKMHMQAFVHSYIGWWNCITGCFGDAIDNHILTHTHTHRNSL